jgi:hypothetical protein
MLRLPTVLLCTVLATSANAQNPAKAGKLDVQVLTSNDPLLRLKPVKLPNGKLSSYTIGIGSAAFRHRNDPDNVIWTAGDRGPNMTCKAAGKLLGKETGKKCAKFKRGRVYPMPDYTPSIYKVLLDRKAGTFKVLQTITIKRAKSGKPVRGLLNPQTVATRDTGVNLAGEKLTFDPDNIDLEGIIRLSDGTFWIGEEMGPSIAHVGKDGRLLKRLVPADAAKDYEGSEAQILPSLPAILSKRQGNRGIESMAVSPDEKYLYFIVQNPLANPNADAYKKSKNARLFKLDVKSGKLVGEYVYQLDGPQSFKLDPSNKQNAPRISEMMTLGADRLLVLERTNKTTKLHEVKLAGATNILSTPWDDAATSPSLEQKNNLKGTGVTPVKKQLRFDTARDFPKAPAKLEGLALLGDGSLAIINDNDFGITGDVTRILIVKGAVNADPSVWRK